MPLPFVKEMILEVDIPSLFRRYKTVDFIVSRDQNIFFYLRAIFTFLQGQRWLGFFK
jgi:hypothetical protein